MYAEERQQAIAQLISQSGRCSVTELASAFQVTTETIRRDLSAIEPLGLIRRVHGGAVLAASLALIEPVLSERDGVNTAAKEAIAARAFEVLPPAGSMLLLDAGSTTGRFAARLPADLQMTVVTHAVPIAARVAPLAGITLELLPGRVRPETLAAVGPDTLEALGRLRVDAALVGTNGITIEAGLTTPDGDEAAVKRAIIGCARRVIVLADSSKLGVEAARVFCSPERIDVLVTDAGITAGQRAELEARGVEVVVA